jgi:hypothetical protein
MPRPRCVECREIAETQWPHALCQAHAIIFYTTVVRVGSGLAALERAAPSGATIWEQQVVPVAEDDPDLLGETTVPRFGGRTCVVADCPYAPRTRGGVYCAPHLRQQRRANSQRAVIARQAERRARRLRQDWT